MFESLSLTQVGVHKRLAFAAQPINSFSISKVPTSKMASFPALLDGSYKIICFGKIEFIAFVNGEDVILDSFDDGDHLGKNRRILKSGVFEKTDEKIFSSTGKANFNVHMHDPANNDDVSLGVVSDDGRIITFKSHHGFVFSMEWVEETEAGSIRTAALNEKDPAEAPSNHYTLKPGQAGKLVWISGAPGYGKSTTARRMMEKEGFVYYEGDCFINSKNPYLPPGDNSAIDAMATARSLKGVPKERRDAATRSWKEWTKLMKGEEDYKLEEFYSLLSENIIQERKRIGGDWVVAQAVPTRMLRDLIKSKLGPDLQFVVLNLDKDHQEERLKQRTETFGEELGKSWMRMKYEAAEDDEENTYDLKITRGMELDDVVEKIVARMNQF